MGLGNGEAEKDTHTFIIGTFVVKLKAHARNLMKFFEYLHATKFMRFFC